MTDNLPYKMRAKSHGMNHRWRKLSFKNQDSKNYVNREELNKSIEEYKKRGGIIKKLQPLETLVPEIQAINQTEQDKWIDEGWK
tara:strand:+ start:196 stop:447 length:252 start_codon:yes stop_codon:yes gene_type:complete